MNGRDKVYSTIKMNLLLRTVMQERQRIENMLATYEAELSLLPRGTISEKNSGGKTYYYLKYRDGKKVVSKYIRRQDVDDMREQIKKRKHIEAMICSLQDEKDIADKVLEGKT